jgi:hypothetical protein
MSTRKIYHVAFSNGWRNTHWATFIPSPNADHIPCHKTDALDSATARSSINHSICSSNPSTGHIIHVIGNKATRFTLEFKPNYSFSTKSVASYLLHSAMSLPSWSLTDLMTRTRESLSMQRLMIGWKCLQLWSRCQEQRETLEFQRRRLASGG